MQHYQQFQLFREQHQPEQALHCLHKHLHDNPRHAYGFFMAGNLLRELGRLPEALCALREACRLDPGQGVFFANFGVLYRELQQPEEAILAYSAALERNNDPGIRFNRAMAMLQAGRYEEGWSEYEWRMQTGPNQSLYAPYVCQKLWHGQPFPGQTLLVVPEQGLGDNLQFCRYLPLVKSRGGKVLLGTIPSLQPILSTLAGADQVILTLPDAYDYAVPLMSLPHLFHTTLSSIPNQVPYLSVLPAYRDKWQTLLAPYKQGFGTRRIGFAFATSNDRHIRSCPLSLWHTLFSLPGLQWFSLQKGDAASAVPELSASCANVVDLTHHIDDFADTAALLDQLDLIVSIDTSVAHLAGALAKPVWLLLPFVGEWRWLLRRCDSPWYPSFRLFRQSLPGQWEPVMAQVRQALLRM